MGSPLFSVHSIGFVSDTNIIFYLLEFLTIGNLNICNQHAPILQLKVSMQRWIRMVNMFIVFSFAMIESS